MASFELCCLSEPRQGKCENCSVECPTLLLCPCGKVKYCSQECQHRHWSSHQDDCQYGLDGVETQVCSACLSTRSGHLSCSCGTTFYCGVTCQNRHWKEHQHICQSRIRVLLREAKKTAKHAGVQCRIKRKASLGGDKKNPLTAAIVTFDEFENSDNQVGSKKVTFGGNEFAASFAHTEEEEESSSAEDVDIVEAPRTAIQIAKSFVRNAQKMSDGFADDAEDDISNEGDGGATTQPLRDKIPVAVYVDMDEIKFQKKQWTSAAGQTMNREIIRRGMLMC